MAVALDLTQRAGYLACQFTVGIGTRAGDPGPGGAWRGIFRRCGLEPRRGSGLSGAFKGMKEAVA